MRTSQLLMAAILLWAAAPAPAHEGGVDARGVVVATGSGHIAIRGADGKELRYAVTAETRVVVGGSGAGLSDVKEGMRAVVHGRRKGDRLEASSIRASAPESPRPRKTK